ncbi:hypothetical protein DL96DRAFT_830578 [Flagelloscypha sp. PMI_526]|nr:hypothetical protein DL96DRAFT_830578 [Flagelloscypha sp. PMI_526]
MLVARAAPTHSVGGTFQTSIVRSIRANSSSYLYEQIAVPQGWYQILAYSSDGRIEKRTTSFFVWNGTDTSCLSNFPSKTTQDDTPASDTTSSSSPTNTTTGSGKSESNKAKMIAGAVVGGFAVLIIVLISIFFLRRRRKHRGGPRATSQQPALSLLVAPRTHITPFEIPSLSLPKAPTTEGQLSERIRALEFTIENMQHEWEG